MMIAYLQSVQCEYVLCNDDHHDQKNISVTVTSACFIDGSLWCLSVSPISTSTLSPKKILFSHWFKIPMTLTFKLNTNDSLPGLSNWSSRYAFKLLLHMNTTYRQFRYILNSWSIHHTATVLLVVSSLSENATTIQRKLASLFDPLHLIT